MTISGQFQRWSWYRNFRVYYLAGKSFMYSCALSIEGTGNLVPCTGKRSFNKYNEIPLLRPPKIKTSYQLKTLFAKFVILFFIFYTQCTSDSPKSGLNIGILLYWPENLTPEFCLTPFSLFHFLLFFRNLFLR